MDITAPSDAASQPVAPRRARGRRSRWVLVATATLLVVLVAVPAAGVLFPQDDALGDPDAIMVLGGAGQERADLGIALSERLEVPLVLSSSATWFAAKRGYRCSLGNALCLYPFRENTAQEASGAAGMLEERGWEHLVVVTSSHHTSRARMLFRQCLGDRVSVVGAPRSTTVGERIWEVAGIAAAVTFRRAC